MSDGSERGKSAGQLAQYKERVRIFVAAVQAGASDRSAAAEAGISHATLHRWRHGERPFDEHMRTRIQRARAIRERRWLDSIQSAATTPLNNGAPGDWRAAAWLMERTNPEYAAVSKHEVSGPQGAPMRVEESVEVRLMVPDVERMRRVGNLLAQAGVPLLPGGENGANGNGSNGHQDGD